MTTEKTTCILCSRNCGLEVEVIDGIKFGKIKGDGSHPSTQGYICQKAARLEHYQNNGDRLKYPLKRLDDGGFVRVSWDEALDDIAQRLIKLRNEHGGDAFAYMGGGGQGNSFGALYGMQLLSAMNSFFYYNALGQEKTGGFWVNGRMFGRQDCHPTEGAEFEHADYILFIGTNPFQSHGIHNARDSLRDMKKDPNKTVVVVDPRRSETVRFADIHLQLKPSTDAFLMLAMLSIIVRENLHDRNFIKEHCIGFEQVERELLAIDVEDYVKRTGLALEDVQKVARGYATARVAAIRADMGLEHTLHVTLNAYLEKLLYLITGNFAIKGGNNLHTSFIPLLRSPTLSHRDERHPKAKLTAKHRMFPIAGIYPPAIVPDEIEHEGEDRLRAIFVDSSNPVLTYPDTKAYERAFKKLDLLVVIDVAMTETAQLAHYVLPAASQFEKWEICAISMQEFPKQVTQLRKPLFPAQGESLPEPEIYTRILEKMGEIPTHFPKLEQVARTEPEGSHHMLFMAALGMAIARHPRWAYFGSSIIYRTLGKTLPEGAASAAPLLPLSILYAGQHYQAVRRAGHQGNRLTLGSVLFKSVLKERSGTVISMHLDNENLSLLKHKGKKIHLVIPEMIGEIRSLKFEEMIGKDYPFILMAGERRSYNANAIYRDPAWRKVDPHGAMRMHPDDAIALDLMDGASVKCESQFGHINAIIEIDDSVLCGVVTLPHGYGARYQGGESNGPQLNLLTGSSHCDPLSKSPFHKYVPVRIYKIANPELNKTKSVKNDLIQPAAI